MEKAKKKSPKLAPNIKKPEVDKNTERSIVKMMSAVEHLKIKRVSCKELVPLMKGVSNVTISQAKKIIEAGDWETVLRTQLKYPLERGIYRMGLAAVLEGDGVTGFMTKLKRKIIVRKHLAEFQTIAKCYEYITGEDYKTGKKIHLGALDEKATKSRAVRGR